MQSCTPSWPRSIARILRASVRASHGSGFHHGPARHRESRSANDVIALAAERYVHLSVARGADAFAGLRAEHDLRRLLGVVVVPALLRLQLAICRRFHVEERTRLARTLPERDIHRRVIDVARLRWWDVVIAGQRRAPNVV